MSTSKEFVSPAWADSQRVAFVGDRANRIARNSVTSDNVMKAARNISTLRTYHDTFSVSRPKTGDVTNQRQSGRCWMFSAFNVMRAATMKLLDVDSFEFSQAYGMFYDKLEKANAFLENVIDLIDRPADDRALAEVLDNGMGDGGFYPYAMNIIAKWGIVPKDAMPETACSKNSAQMDAQLDRLAHRDACELRRMHAEGKSKDELREAKEGMLEGFYRMLCVCLGEPPATFGFEVTVGKDAKVPAEKLIIQGGAPEDDAEDASETEGEASSAQEDTGGTGTTTPDGTDAGQAVRSAGGRRSSRGADSDDTSGSDADTKKSKRRILRDRGITPREFAERYLPLDPDDYVELISIPGETRPFNHAYHVLRNDSVLDGKPLRFLNVEPEVLDAAAVASLEAGVPCEMACDVMQQFPRGIEDFPGIIATDTMDYEGLFDVDLAMDRASMYDLRESSLTHAMTFQGVELSDEGAPVAWRVENSWGKDSCKDGYLTISADWFHLYGGEVVVRREFVPEDVLRMWDELPAEDVEPWSGMGRALGAGRRD